MELETGLYTCPPLFNTEFKVNGTIQIELLPHRYRYTVTYSILIGPEKKAKFNHMQYVLISTVIFLCWWSGISVVNYQIQLILFLS